MEFNDLGYLDAGIHVLSIEELKTVFVDEFDSINRKRIYNNFIAFFSSEFIEPFKDIISKIWIDGSFSTQKKEPNDIDGIIFLSYTNDQEMDKCFLFQKMFQNGSNLKNVAYAYDCDFYVIFDVKKLEKPTQQDDYAIFYSSVDYNFKYWMGQFCFDREQNPKGIIELVFKEDDFNEL